MTSRNPSVHLERQTGFGALWGFIRDSVATELHSILRWMAAPVRALRSGSLEPIRSALRSADEDYDRLMDRYFR
jgi:hypothetical protein